MEVILKEGRDLVIRDSCGTSDPYVKFKIGNRQVYKSRTIFKNLNPKWEEKFTIPIEDPFRPISLRVYDYDRGLNDDPMGGAEIDPSSLELDNTFSVYPDDPAYFKKQNKQSDAKDKKKTQTWSAIVTIVLVEGKGLMAMDDNGYSDPYVKFRLGNERYKSKYKSKTLKPRWLERFDLLMYDDQTSTLEISVWDHDIGGKDDIMGRADLDLSELAPEQTHRIWVELEDGAGEISCYISITGLAADHEASSIEHQKFTPEDREAIVKKYSLKNSARNMNDVGWLRVKVIKAQGLASADIGGKSDPFCVLELGNDRVQTHTEYKTLDPEWGKVFHFTIRDIHANLEVQVFDEDRDRKVEYLGKVAIPLLRIKRKERKWYGLKDRKLMHSVKGAVQLEMDVVFNHLKAAIRTVNPKEEKFVGADVKFKLAIMKKNIARVSKLAEAGVEGGLMLKSILAWESYPKSIGALIGFLVGVYSFELYMVPLSLLLVFLINLVVVHIVGNLMKEEEEYVDEEDDEDEDDDKNEKGEEKKSFKEKLQEIQDICLQVQEGLGMVATMGERVKNTFNWTVPWLAWLAMTALTIGTVVLYYVPIRYLLLAWGLNKFTKKLRKPNAIDNNELLDYLSRVPSDKELMMYRELRPDANIGTMKKRK
ncbi:hypothetical protein CAPTEDRAFT_227763 [Capitella teleta]|uniref:C2 domain-containing protein n=1 Tax=Capitella teleta TaxID=283909 RepID=R7TLS9_CAPTE|nr:hypothetical protein CAPTEDRAFT_227763 [Capitella teleta]|eukprot:ELT94467.1 hypothetical protein CAPTEDRAFT_227763 [Capitella teleta]